MNTLTSTLERLPNGALRWTGLVLLISAMLSWCWASRHYPEIPLSWFYSTLAVATGGWLLGFLGCDDRQRAFLLWSTLALHLIGIAGQPLLEDDHYRFLWDGYQFAATGTPYGSVPEDFFTDASIDAQFQSLVGHINYPELPTIYGATNQYLFLLAYWIKPASITVLQALLSAFNLLLIWQLLKHAPVRYVLLYAWSPLVLKEIAFTAHIDGLGAGLLVLAVISLCGKHGPGRGWGAVLLALASGAKVFAWLLVPFLLVRQQPRVWLIFISTLVVLYLPFVFQPGSELTSLWFFAQAWQFNPALFGLAVLVMPPLAARLLLAGALGLFLLGYWCRYVWQLQVPEDDRQGLTLLWRPETLRQRPWPRADWVFGMLLLVSPVINAWYLLWLLPFAVRQRLCWPWVASIAVMLSYLTWLNLENYIHDPYALPLVVTGIEFGIIGLALLWDYRRRLPGQSDLS